MSIRQSRKKTLLKMYFLCGFINTRDFPKTLSLLKKHTPNVLNTKCFNYENLDFKDEVKATEAGHLFEHVLLDQLCSVKMTKGYNKAEFNGRTFWNWEKNPKGMFTIVLDVGENEKDIFVEAMDKTIHFIETLIQTSTFTHKTSTGSYYQLPAEVGRLS